MKIQVIKSLKTGMYESFAYELRDWTFKFARTWLNRHESITFVLSLLLSVKTYWACMTFSERDIFFVMLLTQCNAMQDKY